MVRWKRWFDRSSPKESSHPVIVQYLERFNKTPGSTPIEELQFSVIDTEMTGLKKDSRLLSIGAVRCTAHELKVSDTFEVYIKIPRASYNPETAPIHGLLPDEKNAQTETAALLGLVEFVKNDICVAHHHQVDKSILNRALFTHFGTRLQNKWIDTVSLASRVENPHHSAQIGTGESLALEALCAQHDISMLDQHTAVGDAYSTALLLMRILLLLRQRGIYQWSQLNR
jgi:DNA polymerase-3 subunit epsilon